MKKKKFADTTTETENEALRMLKINEAECYVSQLDSMTHLEQKVVDQIPHEAANMTVNNAASSPPQDDDYLIPPQDDSPHDDDSLPPQDDHLEASSACSYTFLKEPGLQIVLELHGNTWRAEVHDRRFPGLTRSFSASVAFEKGCSLEDFVSKAPAWQSQHLHIFSSSKHRPVVYIGSAGLKGGGCSCNLPIFTCVCTYQCINGCCTSCCAHKSEHAHHKAMAQSLWNTQAKLRSLAKEQEASARFRKEEEMLEAARAAQQAQLAQVLESLRSERESERAKRAQESEEKESKAKEADSEKIKSTLRSKADLFLDDKDISLSESEAEEDCEETTATKKTTSLDANCQQLSEPSTSRVQDDVLFERSDSSDSESEEDEEEEEETCELATSSSKTDSSDKSGEGFSEPSGSQQSDSGLFVTPPVVDAFPLPPHFIRQDKSLSRFLPKQSSGYDSQTSDNIPENPIQNSSGESFFDDCIPRPESQTTDGLTKWPSLSSLACYQSYAPYPLRRAISLESFKEQPTFQASMLYNAVLDPVSRLLASYNFCLSPEDAVWFYARAGKHISEKLSATSSEVRQEVLNYFYDGGNIYPAVLANYPPSDWLLHSLWHEIATDPKADPFSLETFQEHWESVSEKFTKDHQTSLLQSLWKSRKKKELSLVNINEILDLILSTNTQGDELSYDEPLLDQLVALRNFWLRAKLLDLPGQSPDSSMCKEIADALANSQLSIPFIRDFLNQLKSAEEVDLSSLLSFSTFVTSQEVPEAILSTIVSSDSPDQLNNPRSWLKSLAVQWCAMHLSEKNPDIPSSLFSSMYKKFDQDISVVPAVTDFVIRHASLVASKSSDFQSVLDALYIYKASLGLCRSVLDMLPDSDEWVSSSDKLITITDEMFSSSPPYNVKEITEMVVQMSSNSLQCSLSEETTDSYTNLDFYMLERVCRQHVVKSLQPCLRNEIEYFKNVCYSAMYKIDCEADKVREKLEKLNAEKREIYDTFHKLKRKHDSTITDIDGKKSGIEAKLAEIEKKEKEEINKLKQNEEKLDKELGGNVKKTRGCKGSCCTESRRRNRETAVTKTVEILE